MKKKLHLLCNAHLDPVWLWCKQEGIAEALSTFRVAADFCEQYDGFVFNHNESLLYEWVEEHEPELFERIKKLVAAGKWKIMGGWYLQPDCVMTSGESLLSQIELGRTYFEEKFGVKPTTAINFDPFGHSRGLVQILAATGYDSYIFMRPKKFAGDFWWEGYDGSRILGHGITKEYSTKKGMALARVQAQMEEQVKSADLCLWGIGNHGGGPSKVDLEAINGLIASTPEHEIVHSFAEAYFADLDREKLETRACSLIPEMVGCYTTMTRIKQANRALENKIAVTEKIMTYAELMTGEAGDTAALIEAKKDLAFCQFHDILPGTSIKPAEEESLRTLSHGQEIADRLFTKAFFQLCRGQRKAQEGDIPILVFNPHPYEVEGEFEVDFILQNQNWRPDEKTVGVVYSEAGEALPTQNESPESTFNLDWPKKISFRGKLRPSGITRFDCKLEVVNQELFTPVAEVREQICLQNDRMELVINGETGRIEHYAVDGQTLLKDCGVLEVYRDNEDPWGMTVNSFTNLAHPFRLMTVGEANAFTGYPQENLAPVRVVEDGAVRTRIQSLWTDGVSHAVVEYTVPKQDIYLDVKVVLYSNRPNVMIKYRLDTAFEGTPWGQTAFGAERLFDDRRESVFHKWCALKGERGGLAVCNEGIYGGDFTKNSLRLSLLRTPIYSNHPIGKRQLAPHDRLLNHIDMGERTFRFRITTTEDLERKAQMYNEAPFLLSFFPEGSNEKQGQSAVCIDQPHVILSSMRRKGDGYLLTLHNTSGQDCTAEVTIAGREKSLRVEMRAFELKFVKI